MTPQEESALRIKERMAALLEALPENVAKQSAPDARTFHTISANGQALFFKPMQFLEYQNREEDLYALVAPFLDFPRYAGQPDKSDCS